MAEPDSYFSIPKKHISHEKQTQFDPEEDPGAGSARLLTPTVTNILDQMSSSDESDTESTASDAEDIGR